MHYYIVRDQHAPTNFPLFQYIYLLYNVKQTKNLIDWALASFQMTQDFFFNTKYDSLCVCPYIAHTIPRFSTLRIFVKNWPIRQN